MNRSVVCLILLTTGACACSVRARSRNLGGWPYETKGPPPKRNCGPRTLCWFVETYAHRRCDLASVSRSVWTRSRGTHITSVASEVSRLAGRPYTAVRIGPGAGTHAGPGPHPRPGPRAGPGTGQLACLLRCGPFIALIDVGSARVRSHFVVLLSLNRGRLTWYDVNRGFLESRTGVFFKAWKPFDFGAVVSARCLNGCAATTP